MHARNIAIREGASNAANSQIKGASFGRNQSFGGASKNSIPKITEREDTFVIPRHIEAGQDSARIKKMFNDVDSDVAFYKKMSEVFSTAQAAYVRSRREEEEAKKQLDEAIAAGIVSDYDDHHADKPLAREDTEKPKPPADGLEIDSAQIALKT